VIEDLLLYLLFCAFSGGIAFTIVAICRLAPSRFRSWTALAVFGAGSWAAWGFFSLQGVGPGAWVPFLLTIVGGWVGLLGTLRSAGGLGARAARPVAAVSTLLVVVFALASTYSDANRGVPATLMLADPDPEAYFKAGEPRIEEPICWLRYVKEIVQEEPNRPMVLWTWEQDCPVPWDELSRVPEALFLVQFDDSGGIESTCVRPATDDATREKVEGLIAEWWNRQATFFPPPSPDLRGKTIFRMVRCEYLERFDAKRKQYASEKGHEFIEIHGPTAVLLLPSRDSKPWRSAEWGAWFAGDPPTLLEQVRGCLLKNRVGYRSVDANVLMVEAEGAISRLERSALGGSGYLLFRHGETPRRIACSSAAECGAEFSRIAPSYFGHPECAASPERVGASG